MKIAIMIDSLALGGAQKHVRQLACGLAEAGDEVTVWVLNDLVEPLYAEPLQRAGVRLEVIGRRQVLTGLGLIRVAGRWWGEQVDAIVAVLFVSSVVGRIAAQLAGGIPVVTSLQARNLDYRWWQKALLRITSGLSAWTISNSRSALAWAAAHEGVRGTQGEFVANAIDPPHGSSPLPDWPALGLGELEGRRVIGSLGRLNPQKGYDILLDALAKLPREELEGLRAVIWGEGPERTALEQRRRLLGLDRVVYFPGERADAAGLLPKLDLYVQPSRFEGMPNAVMEALASGCWVLAAAVDGVRELGPLPRLMLQRDGSTAGEWAEAIRELLQRPVQRELLPSLLLQNWSLPQLVDRFRSRLAAIGKKQVELRPVSLGS